eukprot:scaffold22928_cov60-Phaeocystis_antarctica.AAC.3
MQSSPLGRLVTKVGDEMVPGASASSLEPPQPIYPAGKIKASVGAPRAGKSRNSETWPCWRGEKTRDGERRRAGNLII